MHNEQEIVAGRLLTAPGRREAARDSVLRIEGERITEMRAASANESIAGAGRIGLPALANAHDHARALKSVALGAVDLPLELWLMAMSGAPRIDPYLVGAVSLGRSALGGVGSVMVHYTRAQGGMSLVQEAREIARAAHDTGVRIAFTPAMSDRNTLAYGDDENTLSRIAASDRDAIRRRLMRSALPASEQVALVEEIASTIESDLVNVQFGPTGVQWCSEELLRSIAERSAATGRRVHMHLLETRYQREWADRTHPEGLLSYLDSIGLLSPRLSVAHAVWARPDELALLAERGVIVCVNNSSNLFLRSGIAPVRDMLNAKVRVAIGLDGTDLDDDDDALREVRLAYFLHQGLGFERCMDAAAAIHAATDTARRVITGRDEQATLESGNPADLLILDYAALSRDILSETLDDLALVVARASNRHVIDLYVAGRSVVRDGKLCGVDLSMLENELIMQARRGMEEFNEWQRTVVRARSALAAFYAGGPHCH